MTKYKTLYGALGMLAGVMGMYVLSAGLPHMEWVSDIGLFVIIPTP